MDSPGPDTPLYSVAAVARHTGVPAVTLRAWERRYGFPRPSRASGGRRLYTQRDIWTVRALRSQTDQGVPISRAIALLGDGELATAAPAEAANRRGITAHDARRSTARSAARPGRRPCRRGAVGGAQPAVGGRRVPGPDAAGAERDWPALACR